MEKALLTLLDSLDFSKYDVTLVLERAEGALLCQLDSRIKVREFKVCTSKIPIFRKAVNFSRQLAFRITNGKKYDFSCCYATYSNACGKIAAMASDNCALYVHSNYFEYYNRDAEKTKTFFDSINFAEYRNIFFVSEDARRDAAAVYPAIAERYTTLGNLTDVKEIKSGAELEENLPDDGGKFTFVFAGRLDDTSKKLCRLIDAADILKKEGKAFSVWIIGDGPDREKYEERVRHSDLSDRISFLGMKKNPYPFIKKADALVLCSDYEGFPVVYSEALILGCRIITTVKVSDGFFTVDESCALICEKNPASLASAMNQAMSDGTSKAVIPDFADINKQKIKKLYMFMDV